MKVRHPAVASEIRMPGVPPWRYVPVEPIAVMAMAVSVDHIHERVAFPKLSQALAHFTRFHLGPLDDRLAGLLDAHNQIVLGYRSDGTGQCEWFGTALCFELLELFHDRASVVLWAAEAQRQDLGLAPVEGEVPWSSRGRSPSPPS